MKIRVVKLRNLTAFSLSSHFHFMMLVVHVGSNVLWHYLTFLWRKKVKYQPKMFYLALKSVGNKMKGGKSDTFSVLNIGHESVPMQWPWNDWNEGTQACMFEIGARLYTFPHTRNWIEGNEAEDETNMQWEQQSGVKIISNISLHWNKWKRIKTWLCEPRNTEERKEGGREAKQQEEEKEEKKEEDEELQWGAATLQENSRLSPQKQRAAEHRPQDAGQMESRIIKELIRMQADRLRGAGGERRGDRNPRRRWGKRVQLSRKAWKRKERKYENKPKTRGRREQTWLCES